MVLGDYTRVMTTFLYRFGASKGADAYKRMYNTLYRIFREMCVVVKEKKRGGPAGMRFLQCTRVVLGCGALIHGHALNALSTIQDGKYELVCVMHI
jgi:hypothetical protein